MVMDEAIGSFEAAAILGLHFTKPARMAAQGLLTTRDLVGNNARRFVVYSSQECEDNFSAYESAERTGRPRTRLSDRALVKRKLAPKSRPRIAFGDAIGVSQAAEILGVWVSLVPRLVREGKIVGRLLWSERSGSPRVWILSRASVEQRAADVRRAEGAGTKTGRPRSRKMAR